MELQKIMHSHAACLNSLVSAWYSMNAVSFLDSLSKLLLSFHKDILIINSLMLDSHQTDEPRLGICAMQSHCVKYL